MPKDWKRSINVPPLPQSSPHSTGKPYWWMAWPGLKGVGTSRLKGIACRAIPFFMKMTPLQVAATVHDPAEREARLECWREPLRRASIHCATGQHSPSEVASQLKCHGHILPPGCSRFRARYMQIHNH